MPDALVDVLARYGPVIAALAMILEGCGIPVPAVTILVTASALAATGAFPVWGVAIGSAVGGILGGIAGWLIGAHGGIRLVRRYGARMRIDAEKVAHARKFFARRGVWAAFLCRFVGVARILVPMIAGVAHMPLSRFAAANAAGAIAAAAGYSALGWFFGRDLPALRHHLTEATLVATALVVAWLVVWWVRARKTASA